PIATDLRRNEIIGGWKPKTPIYLCGGHRDPEVAFRNSLVAYRYLRSEGVKVTLDDLDSLVPARIPMKLYHDAVFVLCSVVERVNALESGQARHRFDAGKPLDFEDLRPMMGSLHQP
ncbi:MAG: hypothetical protein JO199_12265, partial [Candidatus Eremiobacteraeota bacterium]|nr:hypothetical protein [Candidatus Eremiobacteraeota bacterium]